MQPHRRQPTRLPRPWDSPGKNTGVGCHFLLQCMKVKSQSEVVQSCPTLKATRWIAAYQAPPSMAFSRQEYWSGVPLPSPTKYMRHTQNTYNILRKAFNTPEVLVSHSLVIPFGRGPSCPLPNKIIKWTNEQADATGRCPFKKSSFAPGTLCPCAPLTTLYLQYLKPHCQQQRQAGHMSPEFRKYSTACTPSVCSPCFSL